MRKAPFSSLPSSFCCVFTWCIVASCLVHFAFFSVFAPCWFGAFYGRLRECSVLLSFLLSFFFLFSLSFISHYLITPYLSSGSLFLFLFLSFAFRPQMVVWRKKFASATEKRVLFCGWCFSGISLLLLLRVGSFSFSSSFPFLSFLSSFLPFIFPGAMFLDRFFCS